MGEMERIPPRERHSSEQEVRRAENNGNHRGRIDGKYRDRSISVKDGTALSYCAAITMQSIFWRLRLWQVDFAAVLE